MVAYVQKCNTQSGTRDFSCWYVIVYDRFIVLQHTTYLYNDDFVVIHTYTHTHTQVPTLDIFVNLVFQLLDFLP